MLVSGEYFQKDVENIVQILSNLLGRKNVGADEDILAAGLTSIMVLPLLTEIEDTFEVRLPDFTFLNSRTPRDLARLVQECRSIDP